MMIEERLPLWRNEKGPSVHLVCTPNEDQTSFEHDAVDTFSDQEFVPIDGDFVQDLAGSFDEPGFIEVNVEWAELANGVTANIQSCKAEVVQGAVYQFIINCAN